MRPVYQCVHATLSRTDDDVNDVCEIHSFQCIVARRERGKTPVIPIPAGIDMRFVDSHCSCPICVHAEMTRVPTLIPFIPRRRKAVSRWLTTAGAMRVSCTNYLRLVFCDHWTTLKECDHIQDQKVPVLESLRISQSRISTPGRDPLQAGDAGGVVERRGMRAFLLRERAVVRRG
jgi:hypothetical protein